MYRSRNIDDQRDNEKYRIQERHTAWVTESGIMEFFITASSNSFDKAPKR